MHRALMTTASTIALLAMFGAAQAADIPPRYRAPVSAPVMAPLYNWTGFYVGVNGGGGWGRSRWDSADAFNVSGGLVGGTLGYNYQVGQLVWGVEGDIDWSNIKGTTNTFCGLGCQTSNSWLATARGRLGYAADRFMPYVTGGAAFGDIRASTPGFGGNTTTNIGWTLGGGVEFALGGNWTAKAEYLYVDLGNFNCGIGCGAAVTDNVSFHTNIVRAGINYRF
jgi:outer membrane immunogenic protein